jgi:iron-only hydrogenase group A
MEILCVESRGAHTLPTTAFGLPLSATACINCGQCVLACPTGALTERQDWRDVDRLLNDRKGKTIVVQTAPAVRVTIGEEFGLENGSISTGKLVNALRAAGFDAVMDTDVSADLTIIEEGTELIQRVQAALSGDAAAAAAAPLPMFTSCCPAWVTMVEQSYPELMPHLSTCRSPQAMLSSLLKHYYAAKIGKAPEDVVVVSVMPCVAKKAEAARPELNGETDYVLTVREAAKLLKHRGVRLAALSDDGAYDSPLGISTGAALIFGATGGVMEAALRFAHEAVTGEPLPGIDFKPARGLDAIKTATVDLAGLPLRIAVAHSGAASRQLIEALKTGEIEADFVEVMECPGGCVGGGGNPKSPFEFAVPKRLDAIYRGDSQMELRRSQDSPVVQELYDTFLGKAGGHKSHELLHTHYTAHPKL